MIKIENVAIPSFMPAVRGMRNPLNSWDNIDSYDSGFITFVGEKDMKLMQRLTSAGKDHAKYMRMMVVYVDITAPLYWWKEFDTYKVGTVANSCSTMHKIHAKEFEPADFSTDHLNETNFAVVGTTIAALNCAREDFLKETDPIKKKEHWWQMIQLLPSSYNQKRTVLLNYQVLQSMYYSRKDHKLDEWHVFCDWILSLPYFTDICQI